MICIYAHGDTDYTGNGRAILHPLSADINCEAGTKYEMDIELPKDEEGVWQLANNSEWIIKAPVPGGQTEVAVQGDNAQVWRVIAGITGLVRAQPKEEWIITYPSWVQNTYYTPGTRVTYNNANFECTDPLNQADISVPPVNLSAKWKSIPRTNPGAPIMERLPAGQEFYLLDEYSSYYLHVQTYAGVEGYITKASCEYVRTISAEDIKPRVITEQLFRIKKITSQAAKSIKCWCQHVSYDHTGVEAGTCVINNAAPASAIAQLKNAMLWDPQCTIATNLKPMDGAFSGTMTKKNLVNALLDPDKGIVSYYNARLVRDNWDFFIYRNEERRSPIVIRYANNLAALQITKDTSKLYTRVRPIAKAADGKTDFFLAGDTPWVDSPYLSDYDRPYLLDITVDGKVGGDDGQGGTWTETTLREHMQAQALKKFSEDKVDIPVITMDADWVQLEKTTLYKDIQILTTLSMYDTVRVICEPEGVDADVFLAGFRWDAVREKYKSTHFTNVLNRREPVIGGYMMTQGAVTLEKLSQEVRDKLS